MRGIGRQTSLWHKIQTARMIFEMTKNPISVIASYTFRRHFVARMRDGSRIEIRADEWFIFYSFLSLMSDQKIIRIGANRFELTSQQIEFSFEELGKAYLFELYAGRLGKTLLGFEMKMIDKDTCRMAFEFAGKHLDIIVPHVLLGLIEETYVIEPFQIQNLKDYVVIDVGSSVGDTPIYFALRGASFVLGLEPSVGAFACSLTNVERNGFGSVIEVRNIAVAAGAGTEMLSAANEVGLVPLGESGTAVEVKTASLHDLVNEVGSRFPSAPILVKIDCEGCEYEALPTAARDGSLVRINSLVGEIHGDSRELLDMIVSKGFKVKRIPYGTHTLFVAERN